MMKCSRRNIFRLAGAGSLALLFPALTSVRGTHAWAQDNALDPESPQAKALGYVHHFDEIDKAKYPRFQPGQKCSTCQLAQGDVNAEWVACGIFPGKEVAADGWCNAWVKRQGS